MHIDQVGRLSCWSMPRTTVEVRRIVTGQELAHDIVVGGRSEKEIASSSEAFSTPARESGNADRGVPGDRYKGGAPRMISHVFIDRPRLAMVISVVITIAGLIAMTAIPTAQFPEIVPPQVGISTAYPGANAKVVEETVAQVIEAKVTGVDNMIYMKSTSSDDGRY